MEVPPQFQQIADELAERGGAPADGPATGSQASAAAEGSGVLSSGMGGAADGAGAVGPPAGVEAGCRGSGDGGGAVPSSGGVPRKYTITPHDGPGSAADPAAAAGVPPPHAQQQQHAAANGTASGPVEPAMTLLAAGQRYHVVNTQLLLLSMLREYAAFRDAVPAFAAEVCLWCYWVVCLRARHALGHAAQRCSLLRREAASACTMHHHAPLCHLACCQWKSGTGSAQGTQLAQQSTC